MSQGRAFRVRDVAAYLRVSQQRGAQMYAEGKLPEPDEVDGIGPMWKPAAIEWWAEREWWGTRRWRKHRESEKPPEPEGPSDFSTGKLALEVLPVKSEPLTNVCGQSNSLQIRSHVVQSRPTVPRPGLELFDGRHGDGRKPPG